MRTQVSMAGWVLCMILVLSALAGVLGETRYEKFQRQHVDNPRRNIGESYCDTMMRRRVLTPGGPCKDQNTFVHAPVDDLKAACYRAPEPNTNINKKNIHSTSMAMHVTYCKLHRRNMRPPCYYTEQQLWRRVFVACINRLPVHLEDIRP